MFFLHPKSHWRFWYGFESGSVSHRYASEDPHPDPTKMSWIRNTDWNLPYLSYLSTKKLLYYRYAAVLALRAVHDLSWSRAPSFTCHLGDLKLYRVIFIHPGVPGIGTKTSNCSHYLVYVWVMRMWETGNLAIRFPDPGMTRFRIRIRIKE